jgi:chemotaxis protein CheX
MREDYNGLIEVGGGFAGSICFSAPRRMLDFVLLASGDNDFSEAKYLDIVGEVANTLSGRARSYFGETLLISPPLAFKRESPAIARRTHGKPYAIPIVWRSLEANLVVHLSRL